MKMYIRIQLDTIHLSIENKASQSRVAFRHYLLPHEFVFCNTQTAYAASELLTIRDYLSVTIRRLPELNMLLYRSKHDQV